MCSFVLALRCALLNLPFSQALIWQFSVSANYGSRSRLLRPRALWTALHRLAAPCRRAARYRPGHPQHAPGAGAHLPGDAGPKVGGRERRLRGRRRHIRRQLRGRGRSQYRRSRRSSYKRLSAAAAATAGGTSGAPRNAMFNLAPCLTVTKDFFLSQAPPPHPTTHASSAGERALHGHLDALSSKA
jgi:hypothetical protein